MKGFAPDVSYIRRANLYSALQVACPASCPGLTTRCSSHRQKRWTCCDNRQEVGTCWVRVRVQQKESWSHASWLQEPHLATFLPPTSTQHARSVAHQRTRHRHLHLTTPRRASSDPTDAAHASTCPPTRTRSTRWRWGRRTRSGRWRARSSPNGRRVGHCAYVFVLCAGFPHKDPHLAPLAVPQPPANALPPADPRPPLPYQTQT